MYVKVFAVTAGLGHTLTGQQLTVLGTTAGDEATVELTNMQQVLVMMDAAKAPAARKALHAAGMKTYDLGAVVKNVQMCGLCQSEPRAEHARAVALDATIAGLDVPFPMRISYSGCPNACAEPLLQDIGIVRTEAGFDVYGGGGAAGLSPHSGKLIHHKVSARDLPGMVRRTVVFYQTVGRGREPFWRFVDRVGVDALKKAAAKYWQS